MDMKQLSQYGYGSGIWPKIDVERPEDWQYTRPEIYKCHGVPECIVKYRAINIKSDPPEERVAYSHGVFITDDYFTEMHELTDDDITFLREEGGLIHSYDAMRHVYRFLETTASIPNGKIQMPPHCDNLEIAYFYRVDGFNRVYGYPFSRLKWKVENGRLHKR